MKRGAGFRPPLHYVYEPSHACPVCGGSVVEYDGYYVCIARGFCLWSSEIDFEQPPLYNMGVTLPVVSGVVNE